MPRSSSSKSPVESVQDRLSQRRIHPRRATDGPDDAELKEGSAGFNLIYTTGLLHVTRDSPCSYAHARVKEIPRWRATHAQARPLNAIYHMRPAGRLGGYPAPRCTCGRSVHATSLEAEDTSTSSRAAVKQGQGAAHAYARQSLTSMPCMHGVACRSLFKRTKGTRSLLACTRVRPKFNHQLADVSTRQ